MLFRNPRYLSTTRTVRNDASSNIYIGRNKIQDCSSAQAHAKESRYVKNNFLYPCIPLRCGLGLTGVGLNLLNASVH